MQICQSLLRFEMIRKVFNRNSERRDQVHMPADSFLYEQVVPALLVIMACVMFVIVLLALGVLLGLVPYQ